MNFLLKAALLACAAFSSIQAAPIQETAWVKSWSLCHKLRGDKENEKAVEAYLKTIEMIKAIEPESSMLLTIRNELADLYISIDKPLEAIHQFQTVIRYDDIIYDDVIYAWNRLIQLGAEIDQNLDSEFRQYLDDVDMPMPNSCTSVGNVIIAKLAEGEEPEPIEKCLEHSRKNFPNKKDDDMAYVNNCLIARAHDDYEKSGDCCGDKEDKIPVKGKKKISSPTR